MYICVCRAVTDRQLKSAIEGGACTRKELADCLGVGRVCGKCNADVKAMLDGAGCSRASECSASAAFAEAVQWPGSLPVYHIPQEAFP
jgi:bacterioferritin-associated ferredoxin